MKRLRIHIISFIILLGCIGNLNAQLINSAGPFLNTLEQSGSLSIKDDKGNILFLKRDFRGMKSSLHKYNGNFWVNSAKTDILSNPSNMTATEENGEELVFVVNQSNDSNSISMWNGKSWTKDECFYSSRQGVDTSILLVKHEGKVYFFGSAFDGIGASIHNGAAFYENGAWKAAPDNYPTIIDKAVSVADTLYILGSEIGAGSNKVYKYSNDQLIDSIPNGDLIIASTDYIIIKEGNDYILGHSGVFISYTDTLTKYGIQEVIAMDEYKGRIVIHARTGLGEGIFNFDNKEFYPLPFNYRGRLHCTEEGDFISPAQDSFNQNYQLGKIEWDASLVSGQVFLDLNKTCFFETGDVSLKNFIVSVDSFHTATDGEGKYSLFIPADLQSKLSVTPPKHFKLSCIDSSINSVKDVKYVRDIGFQPQDTPAIEDLEVSLVAGIAREGHRVNYNVNIKNIGNSTSETKELIIEFDQRLTDFQSSLSHVITNNKVSFTLPSLSVYDNFKVRYTLYVDETALDLGDSLFAEAHIPVDDDSLNNNDTLYKVVIAAFDPNRKECIPGGLVTKPVDYIRYTIRFQNTGTDTAFKVIVEDTLERKFSMINAKVLSTSHPLSYKLLPPKGNALTWVFDDIMLPDSTTDFEGSQGYITFEIKLKNDLEIGDSVRNRAHIYFDYQKPVTTNFAILERRENIPDTILIPEHNILVYPNPANSNIKVKNNRSENINFKIFDICGKLILDENIDAGIQRELSLDHVSLGMYIMRFDNGYIGKLVKVE